MVKNGAGSLRGSTSNLSLRNTAQQEQILQYVQDLERKVARLKGQAEARSDSQSLFEKFNEQLRIAEAEATAMPSARSSERHDLSSSTCAPDDWRSGEHDCASSAPASRLSFSDANTKLDLTPTSKILSPEAYTKPFCDFLTENPTVFHAVDYFEKKLSKAGFRKVSTATINILSILY
jgi:hypothetical protein